MNFIVKLNREVIFKFIKSLRRGRKRTKIERKFRRFLIFSRAFAKYSSFKKNKIQLTGQAFLLLLLKNREKKTMIQNTVHTLFLAICLLSSNGDNQPFSTFPGILGHPLA